jgi:Helix-turn-helix domain
MVIEGLGTLLTYRDLRKVLRCSQGTAEMLVRTRQIPSVTIGAPGSKRPRRMFRPEDVEAYLTSRSTAASCPTP